MVAVGSEEDVGRDGDELARPPISSRLGLSRPRPVWALTGCPLRVRSICCF